MKNSKIIYSINIKDVQEVAEEIIDRKLSDIELKVVEREIGDYIDWYDALETVISQKIENFENE